MDTFWKISSKLLQKKGKKVRFNFLRREAKGWRQSWWEMNETKKKNGGIMKKRRKIGHEG